MNKAISTFFKISLLAFCYLFNITPKLLAQVTSDGTVNTQVNQNGDSAEITGGETRGGNLFHSFQDFSVTTGNEAFFNNANDISNIFSRVTGGNISNIDGAIRANGSANLFLINPAGIIFGENARLDIGGSFYGSTASSILFEEGEFSAADLENPPILTVNAPIGLGFRDNPGDIVNRSIVQNSAEEVIGLEVNPGNNLTFVASNLNFEGGSLTASGGDIYFGAISESGTVEISENGNLSFAEDISRGNITLSNGSEVDVRGSGGGNIKVDVRNLNLEGGELGISSIRAGISAESTAVEAQAGDITIDATGDILFNQGEFTNNQLGIGNSGNVFVTTGSLSLLNGSLIATITEGQGNAGAVNVAVTGDIIADGEDLEGVSSGITSRVFPDAIGNSGEVTVSTNNLILTNGGRVDAGVGGQGNAGAVNVTATGDINIDGVRLSRGIASGISSRINPDSVGDAEGVTISTNNLNLTNGGRVDASTAGQGDAGTVNVTATGDITIDGERLGDTSLRGVPSGITSRVSPIGEGNSGGVTISTNNLNLTNSGEVSASTGGQGNAGAVNVTATGDITIDGEGSRAIPSGITSRVDLEAEGDAGDIIISTTNLNLTGGGNVSATTEGQGNAGIVDVTATGDIIADGEDSSGFASGIFSTVDRNVIERNAIGNSGGVTISTNNLNLTAGGRVDASTFAQGNAGIVNVTATGDITADGEASRGLPSGIFSTVDTIVFSSEERNAILQPAIGNSGGVTISTKNLSLTAGGSIDASTFAQGNAGPVNVLATGDITADGEASRGATSGITSRVFPPAVGDAGGVNVSINNLNLTNGGRVDASTAGQGNAGAVNVTATGDITIDGERLSRPVPSGITSRVNQRGKGNSGGVTVSTSNLNLSGGGNVDASTGGQGNAGAVNVTATGDITADGEGSDGTPSGITSSVDSDGEGNAGGIKISTSNLSLTGGGNVSATTFGKGNANNVTIEATESLTINGFIESSRSGISANALNQDGNGGGLFISTRKLSVANGGAIEATNFDNIGELPSGTGRPGSISIIADTIGLTDNARIETATQSAGGESGIIDLQVAENIILRNNSFISAQAFNNADGGNINIDSRFTIAFPSNGNGNDIIANAEDGVGGNIQINSTLLGIRQNSATENNRSNDIDASSQFNLDGNITINTPDNNLLQGVVELPNNIVVPEETSQQACEANRESADKNGLNITGKGGILPEPGLPLSSLNVTVNGETSTTPITPKPIETIQGKVQPARGLQVTESGDIILTAHRTSNSGDRISEAKRNCGQV